MSMNETGLIYKTGFKVIDEGFVKGCDYEFDKLLNSAVDEVCIKQKARIIGITGPSCSGKTTTANKLIRYYVNHGIKVNVISLDDFYKDQFSREIIAGEEKSIDFDSPDTLDTELLHSFVYELFSKGEAEKPIFDFASGERLRYEKMYAGENDVFIFEGIQVLYPQVEKILHEMNGESIYICAESGIKVGDITVSKERVRLLRRLVRDCNFRGSEPEFVLNMWGGVRRNEELNIFPYTYKCDIHIDTTQAYELNILKPYLEKNIAKIRSNSEHYPLCCEIMETISDIEPISKDALSEDSLYKEFV